MVLLTSGAVLLLTTASLFAYEFLTFRQASRQQLDTLGKAIAANSTAALAFDNRDDAEERARSVRGGPAHRRRRRCTTAMAICSPLYPKGTPGSDVPAAAGHAARRSASRVPISSASSR